MKWVFNDGGRSNYFSAKSVNDCVVRAIAIATQRDYNDVYNTIGEIVGYSPRNGVYRNDLQKIMKEFGGTWTPCMSIGSGCKVHLKDGELPMDARLICNVSKHLTCVINGVINDTFDPSRGESRCVYGYWIFNNNN